jgi:alanine dehydrogenase
MIIGVLKEIKAHENRVAMTPAGVEIAVARGHQVLVERGAGWGSGMSDGDYAGAGARIAESPETIWSEAELILHVKEPQPCEYPFIQAHHTVFTYFHFAADAELTAAIQKTGCTALAYETVRGADGSLPLLTPMSEVAGRMAIQEAAKYNERSHGGRGILLGGVTGVSPATVLIIGGGVVGTNAATMAAGLGAQVYILDTSLPRLRYLSEIMPKNVIPLMSSPAAVRQLAREADAIIGAVLVAGAKAPKLISREMLRDLKPGCVLVDVAIDQGGCFETSRPTTHADPIYEVNGIIHYCVANMPGAVPITSTYALTNATLPYVLALASKGWKQACREDTGLAAGLNMVGGHITHPGVAAAFDLHLTPVETLLA